MTDQLRGQEPEDDNRWAVDALIEAGWSVRIAEDGVYVTPPGGPTFACLGDTDEFGEGITVAQLYAAWQSGSDR